jgi:hypothetical protein
MIVARNETVRTAMLGIFWFCKPDLLWCNKPGNEVHMKLSCSVSYMPISLFEVTGWALQWWRNMFPVRYELNSYIMYYLEEIQSLKG